jgi:hypothetical protein
MSIQFENVGNAGSRVHSKSRLKAWWQPVLNMKIDDPQQEAPYWVGTNNVVLNTPYPGIQIKALAIVDTMHAGVFLSGTRRTNVFAIHEQLRRERSKLSKELPKGTEIRSGHYWPIILYRTGFKSDERRQEWIIKTINEFVRVLRPRLRRWHHESRHV